MNTCVCGNPASGNGTTCQRCDALHELGLKAGATDAEVKTAHRLYVKAWHPDRFPGDEKSKSAAQEKLKSINAAYEFLTSPSSKRGQTYRPKPAAPPPQPQEPTQQNQNSAKQSPPAGGRSHESRPKANNGGQTPPPPPPYGTPRPSQPQNSPNPWPPVTPRRPDWISSQGFKTFLRYAAIICAVSFGKLFWHNFDAKPTDNAYTKAYDQQRAKALRDLDSPKYLTVPVTPTAPMKDKPLGEFNGKKPNSGTKANPQSGLYDMGVDSFQKKDYVSARFLFAQVCNAGDMKACNYLGFLYARGLGGDQDQDKARDVYQKACDQGTLTSCASLGSLYQDAGNFDEARNYFQKACDGGVAQSCRLLRGVQ